MRMRVSAAVVWVGMLAATLAQTPRSPAIEVASIKASGNGTPTLMIEPGGRFVSTHNAVRLLLSLAFGQPGMGLRGDQIVDAPSWVNTALFDITIKAETPADLPVRFVPRSPELASFLRVLLADRFKLAAHMEKRERPVYTLVMRNGTRLGPDVHPSSVDCASEPCGTKPSRECPTISCLQDIGVTMDQFAYDLPRSPQVDRPVLNRTGLEGRYDLIVRWLAQPSAARRAAGVPDVAQADEVSIFTSIQDRLGLKLEATTAPLDTLVIDHLERPTED